MIDRLQERLVTVPSSAVAYMYFSYQYRSQQTPLMVVQCLIRQLWTRGRWPKCNIVEPLLKLYNLCLKKARYLTFLQSTDLLEGMVTELSTAFFVFDALDECDEKTRRMDPLQFFKSLESKSLRIFITGRRFHRDIDAWVASFGIASIKLYAHDQDVAAYVESTIVRHSSAKRMICGELRKEVICTLVKGCQEM